MGLELHGAVEIGETPEEVWWEMGRLKTVRARVELALGALAGSGLEREEGQTLVEYALILAFIGVVVIGALTFVQGGLSDLFSKVGSDL